MVKKIVLIFSGLLLSLILLEAGMRTAGSIYLYLQDNDNKKALKSRAEYRILCLGESTTQRQYPKYLEEELNSRGLGINFRVIDKGKSGTTTSLILAGLKDDLEEYKPDMVVTMMGINDEREDVVFDDGDKERFYKKLKTYKLLRLIKCHIKSNIEKKNKEIPRELISTVQSEEKHNKAEYPSGKDINKDLNNNSVYKILGDYYKNQSRYNEAEELYMKEIEQNPDDERSYIELGDNYRIQGRFKGSEAMLRKAIELNPNNPRSYKILSDCYRVQGRIKEAEELNAKAVNLGPNNENEYISSGNSNIDQASFKEAEDLIRKVIVMTPKNESAYISLGDCLRIEGEYKEAEKIHKKAIELNPNNEWGYIGLGDCYRIQAKYKEAEEMYGKAIKLNPKNKRGYLSLDTETINNYKKIRMTLKERGVKYTCVQYPARKVGDLKKIFHGDREIVYVDNENIFKDAVKREGYSQYFKDMFAIDFGHCTVEGNRLLAKNIADTIVREVFNSPRKLERSN